MTGSINIGQHNTTMIMMIIIFMSLSLSYQQFGAWAVIDLAMTEVGVNDIVIFRCRSLPFADMEAVKKFLLSKTLQSPLSLAVL